ELWTTKLEEHFVRGHEAPRGDFEDEDPEEESGMSDQPGMAQAKRVFNVLGEREEILGELYPFDVSDDEIRIKDGVDMRASSYIALLAITVAHAHGIEVPHDPTQVLEDTVALALRENGLAVSNV